MARTTSSYHDRNNAPEVQIVNDHPNLFVYAGDIEKAIHRLVEDEGYTIGFLSVVLTDHDTVKRLNQQFLGRSYSTDVLAFSLLENAEANSDILDGEIYVDLETAKERHTEFGATFEQETLRYIIHGVLHLMGYDDSSPEHREEMHRREDRYL